MVYLINKCNIPKSNNLRLSCFEVADNNPLGSKYTGIPSSDIKFTNSLLTVFPENGEIKPDNPDKYYKQIPTPIAPTNLNQSTQYTPDSAYAYNENTYKWKKL